MTGVQTCALPISILLSCLISLVVGIAVAEAQSSNNGNAKKSSSANAAFASKGLEGAPKKADPNACAPAPKDPALWDKSLQGGFNYSEGNSNVSSINANTKLSRDFEG